jgi:hypothetical protein
MVIACCQDNVSPIIFDRTFLHTIDAEINLPKEKVVLPNSTEFLQKRRSEFLSFKICALILAFQTLQKKIFLCNIPLLFLWFSCVPNGP